jgi:hypothetical protein
VLFNGSPPGKNQGRGGREKERKKGCGGSNAVFEKKKKSGYHHVLRSQQLILSPIWGTQQATIEGLAGNKTNYDS